MSLSKIPVKEVGRFVISIESNETGGGTSRIEGNALAVIGGMTTLASRVAKMLRDTDSTAHSIYLLSMLQALTSSMSDNNQSESESASDVNLSDIHPSVSPDQKKIDALFDKLFGGR